MNNPIIKPEWIPAAYADVDKNHQAQPSVADKPKLKLLKIRQKK